MLSQSRHQHQLQRNPRVLTSYLYVGLLEMASRSLVGTPTITGTVAVGIVVAFDASSLHPATQPSAASRIYCCQLGRG